MEIFFCVLTGLALLSSFFVNGKKRDPISRDIFRALTLLHDCHPIRVGPVLNHTHPPIYKWKDFSIFYRTVNVSF